jgi:hypothetical protein
LSIDRTRKGGGIVAQNGGKWGRILVEFQGLGVERKEHQLLPMLPDIPSQAAFVKLLQNPRQVWIDREALSRNCIQRGHFACDR